MEILLLHTSDTTQWNKQFKALADAYQDYGFTTELASALSNLLEPLLSDRVSQAAAEAWNEAWKQTLTPYALPEFDLPLRLMQTAVDYKTSRDKKVLLRLPIEERKIIEAAQSRSEEVRPPTLNEEEDTETA